MSTPTVHAHIRGHLAEIVLDRPKALNALNREMVHAVREALDRFAAADDVAHVVLRSSSPRAFCAGGDIRAVREHILAGDTTGAVRFFRQEYDLDHLTARFPKPILAVLEGVTMGGGLGLSIHGSHRLVTDTTVAAMPETAIGFVPDVGSSHVLSRLGGYGRSLGLTGARLGPTELLDYGLATHRAQGDDLPILLGDLADHDLDAVLAKYALTPSERAECSADHTEIEEIFGSGSLEEVRERLRHVSSDLAGVAAAALDTASPLSLRVTDELLARAAHLDLRACLDLELHVVSHVIQQNDFAEGIRAALVDRTADPRWEHPSAAAVPDGSITAMFPEESQDP